jgi:hypothetical protein
MRRNPHLNERGKPFAAKPVASMLASPSAPAASLDAFTKALQANPRFKLLPPSGAGFIIGGVRR